MQTLKLTKEASKACYNLLTNSKPRGRQETRCHSRIFRAFELECCTRKEIEIQGQFGESVQLSDGNMSLTDDDLKFLTEMLDKKFKEDIPGSMSCGYMDLDSEVDRIRHTKSNPKTED